MFAFIRFVVALCFALSFSLAAPLVVRESSQGQPVSVGRTADRTAEASTVFGTTTDSPNFTEAPTSLCIVPKYASEAGIGEDKTPLITQQALDLCPQATHIAVCEN